MTKKVFRVQWHVTERCNLKCIHCYQDKLCIKDELSLEETKKGLDMLKKTVEKWGMECEVSITGGEPFLRKDWFEICKYIEEKGFYLSILSNGTLLGPDIIKKLKQLKSIRYIQISLDGGNKETHEFIRGKGNFDKAIESIKLLKKNGFKVATKFTVHKRNLSNLKEYLDLTKSLNVDFVSVARYIPWGNGKDILDYFLNKEEIKGVYELVLSYAEKNKGKIEYDVRRPLWILLKKEGNNVGGRCTAGLMGLTILPNGDILPCRPMGIVLGNILKNTFFEVWYLSDILWKIRNYKDWKCGKCENNFTCGGCLAISNAIHKDYFVEDDQCFKELLK